jgi:hypothetical protein
MSDYTDKLKYPMGKPTMNFLRRFVKQVSVTSEPTEDDKYIYFTTQYETPMMTLRYFGYEVQYHEVTDGYNKFHHNQVRVLKVEESEEDDE